LLVEVVVLVDVGAGERPDDLVDQLLELRRVPRLVRPRRVVLVELIELLDGTRTPGGVVQLLDPVLRLTLVLTSHQRYAAHRCDGQRRADDEGADQGRGSAAGTKHGFSPLEPGLGNT